MARFASLISLFLLAASTASGALPVNLLRLPPGFRVSVWSDQVPNARTLARAPDGTIFVGTRTAGKVYAVRDTDGDGRADQVRTIVSGWKMPNGVAFREGSLYVAEVHRIHRFDGILQALATGKRPRSRVIQNHLPSDTHHGWKFIRFGPDDRLYVPVGAPCNVCDPELPYAAIHDMDPDNGRMHVYARGVRNTVGFDWDPATGDLWFTDNGRDHLGDDLPPDELNHAPVAGRHFGFPYRHGKAIEDPKYGRRAGKRDYVPAAQELGPHVAALGMRFYTGTSFPPTYRGQIFIPEHGSWNRSTPLGYRITMVRLKDGEPTGYDVFCDGWLQGEEPWGRPVDLLNMPDGSMLVSDDHAGAIYRIQYDG